MKSQLANGVGLQDIIAKADEFVPLPMLILDRSFRVFYYNSAACEFLNLGMSVEQEMFFPDIIAKESLANLEEFFEGCFESSLIKGTSVDKISALHRCKLHLIQGNQKEVEIQAEAIQDNSELFLLLYLRDLSQHSPADQAVQVSQAVLEADHWYHNILDNTGAVIYIKDIQGRYQFVNHLFEELFHVCRDEFCGKTDYDLFPQNMADRFRRVDEQVCLTGEVQRIQEVVPHDDGPHHYISVKFPLYNLRGDLTGIAGISTDISEQLHAQKELQAAQAVQKHLYPESAPQIEGFDVAGRVSPAEGVSGDFFDYIRVSPDRLVVAVGDVSGHGLGPALEMVETRSYLRAILRTEVRLDIVMECLNEFLYQDLRDAAFVTLFLAEIDFKNKSFTFVGAGHQAEFVKADGTCISLHSTGLMLGINSKERYSCSACYFFEPDDLLLITTDGIAESMSPEGELFGSEKILEITTKNRDKCSDAVIDKLLEESSCFSGKIHQVDDMTAVAIKRLR